MFRKLLAFVPLVCFIIALTSCGGGGGGGSDPLYRAVLLYEDSFPKAELRAGWNGIGYGQSHTPPNIQTALAYDAKANIVKGVSFHPGAPGDYTDSGVLGADAFQQVGYAEAAGSSVGMIWTGTAASATPVTATGWNYVVLNAVDNNYQAGGIWKLDDISHPVVFHGASDDFVDLLPAGFEAGVANCIDGNQIGGQVQVHPFDFEHAALWTSHSAASFINLHSATYETTEVTGISGSQQVGRGTFTGNNHIHALMWTGTPESVVDMNPPGVLSSEMLAVRDNVQIGDRWVTVNALNVQKACIWTGTPDSMQDLDHFITIPHEGSVARSIDAQGNIYGVVLDNGFKCAVVWLKS